MTISNNTKYTKYTKTSLKHYNVTHPMKSPEVQTKREQTCLLRYGVRTPLNSKTIRDKAQNTCLSKYGVLFFSSSKDGKQHISETRKSEKEYVGEYYDITSVKSFCKNIDEKYLKSGGYRTLIKQDKKMYHSIMWYSQEINDCINVSFRAHVYFLQGKISEYKCPKCNKPYKWDNYEFVFKMPKSDPHYKYDRSLQHYITVYGETKGKQKYNAYLKSLQESGKKHRGTNTKEYYIKKYGEVEGKIRFNENISKRLLASTKSYSKISQKFFDELVQICKLDKSKCFYATNNGEKSITVPKEFECRLQQGSIRPDFTISNKIIEFNGIYWHRNSFEKDYLKKRAFESLGYSVLTIWEDEDWNTAIDRAKRFINSNRFTIETTDGYSSFDGIAKHLVNSTLKIYFGTQFIEVSKNHKFIVFGDTVQADTLKIGDRLQTKNGEVRITNIVDCNESKYVYDILETTNHSYIANGVINHNCDFIGSSYTLIDSKILSEMKSAEPEFKYDNLLDVYEEPIQHHKYILSADPAKGGLDAFAVQIIDISSKPFKQVASAQIFKCNYQKMPMFLDEWGKRYNNAFMIVENNEGAGTYCATALQSEYEYPNLYFDKTTNGKKKQYAGFRTTPKSRNLILDTLKLFVNEKLLIVNDKNTINEFFTFIIKDGKYQADDGCHDDMIMSLALAFAPFSDTKNFEDLPKLINSLYDKNVKEVDFSDYLAIGNFDTIDDDNYQNIDNDNDFVGFF